MLRLSTPEDRGTIIALVLAEDAAWSDAPKVSEEEAGEFIDDRAIGVIFERDGKAAGYAAAGKSGGAVLITDPDDPEPALGELVPWLAAHDRHELDSYAGDTRRIAWLTREGFAHVRSSFDLDRTAAQPVLAAAVWPDGVSVEAYRRGEQDVAVHQLVYVDAAWAAVPGHAERGLDAWRELITPEYRGFVARRGQRPIGWVAGRLFPDSRGWIQQLAVAADQRSAGLGRALLTYGLQDLIDHGANTLALGVQAANADAIGLYLSVGFQVAREWRIYRR